MKKISEEQLNAIKRDTVNAIVFLLHDLCPKTMSGKHYFFKRFVSMGEAKELKCMYCGMFKLK